MADHDQQSNDKQPRLHTKEQAESVDLDLRLEKRDRHDVVERSDDVGSEHVNDNVPAPIPDADTPLVESVSADVAPMVGEFMEQAAAHNEAAAEAVADIRSKPGPYISFEHVYKSFGSFVVLEDVSFCVLPGRDALHSGTKRRGKVSVAADVDGISDADKGTIRVAGRTSVD